jgi:hypothetical protein
MPRLEMTGRRAIRPEECRTMDRSKYLNTILTINAALVACLVWTQVANTPLLSSEASAQSFSRETSASGSRSKNPYKVPTIPNAASQRYDMVQSLGRIERSMERMNDLLESGRVRVEVGNLDAIRQD